MANSQVGITLISKFTYRGSPEEYSNTYWFGGTTPGSATVWKAATDDLIAKAKVHVPSTVSFVRAYGYNAPPTPQGSPTTFPPNVWTYDYAANSAAVAGTWTGSAFEYCPGDAAVWLRFETARRTNPGGKKIYLRKYFHPAIRVAGTLDTVHSSQKAQLEVFGGQLIAGILSAAYPLKSAYNASETLTNPIASTYVTTRTLKRRGKRNPT